MVDIKFHRARIFALQQQFQSDRLRQVFLVLDKTTGAEYAIKQMEKSHLIKEKKQKYALTERDILTRCVHPNIIQLHYTFRDEQHLCRSHHI